IDGLGVERDYTLVVQAIIRLAHALDLTSVAEGVETADQLRVLTDLGCDMAQGYYIAASASAVAVTTLLRGRPPCA
ncbi:MAG: EAL domain-containing protein, partial [Frankiaceae bacterium]